MSMGYLVGEEAPVAWRGLMAILKKNAGLGKPIANWEKRT